MATTRREFVKTAAAACALGATLHEDAVAIARAASSEVNGTPADRVARDESYWTKIQQAYDVDRSTLNLNNGGVAPAPRKVLDAMYALIDQTNNLPPQQLWEVLDPQVEPIRERLAKHFGCDAEEIAITRNASESLETCLFGIDLKPGDEILTTTHDYPRMKNTIRQRELREGVVVKKFSIPAPAADPMEIVELFEQHITPRTRMILVCHIVNITGQIVPIKPLMKIARAKGIAVIVDGAHAFAHFRFKRDDLDCDYYGTSLHKWLSAPIGTGLLYVRKAKIASLWPLMAPDEEQREDIRKFEEIGTHPTAPRLAIGDALDLFEAIGPERKEARLRYLRDRWALPLSEHSNVKLFTSLKRDHSCCIATVGIEGIDPSDLRDWLLAKHRIFVAPIEHDNVFGIRVTPNTYTTIEEVDRFTAAMQTAATRGIA